jgi:hypothetical protein
MKKLLLLALALIFSAQIILMAQVPSKISYQGLATDASGAPITGTHSVTVTLYTVLGLQVWTDSFYPIEFDNGVFSLILGENPAAPLPVFNQPYEIGISIDGGAELTPRMPLTSAPYALMAGDVLDGIITNNKLADNSVSNSKILDYSITNNKFAPGVWLPPGGPAGGDLTGNYPNPVIAPLAVTHAKLGNLSVSEIKLQDDAVTTPKILDDAVTSQKIGSFEVEGALGNDDIDLFTIGNLNIGIGEVSGSKGIGFNNIEPFSIAGTGTGGTDIEAGSIDTPELANNAVTTPIIANSTVVRDLNALTDHVVLVPGRCITITPDAIANTIEIAMPCEFEEFNGVLIEKDLIIINNNGDTVFIVRQDGTSWHKGLEEYDGGIRVNTPETQGGGKTELLPGGGISISDGNGNPRIRIGQDGGITIYNPDTGEPSTEFNPDGTSRHTGKESFEGGMEVTGCEGGTITIDENGLSMTDANGNTIFSIACDGTSYHTGLETFAEGIRIPTYGGGYIHLDNSGIYLIDPDGNLLTGFSYDGTSYHFGTEYYFTSPFISLGAHGDVTFDPETGSMVVKDGQGVPRVVIGSNGSITLKDENGEVTTQFNSDGTSTHIGHETFEGGLSASTCNGGTISMGSDGLWITNSEGESLFGIDCSGNSFHGGDEYFFGDIHLIDGQIHFPDGTTQSTSAQSFDGILDNIPFAILDENGWATTVINPDGTSFHHGHETFLDDITVFGTVNINGTITFDDGSIQSTAPVPFDGELNNTALIITDEQGNITTMITPDGVSIHNGHEFFNAGLTASSIEFEDGTTQTTAAMPFNGVLNDVPLIITNADGEPTTALYPNGQSYHWGHETFFAGATFLDGGITFEDGTSQTTAAQPFEGVLNNNPLIINDIDGNTMVSVYPSGNAEFGGDIDLSGNVNLNQEGTGIVFPDGTVQTTAAQPFNGELNNNPLIIRNSAGEVTTMFDTDGTSYHHGLEYFFGGIRVKGQNNTAFTVTNDSEESVIELNSDGTSEFTGNSTLLGGLTVPSGDGGFSITNEGSLYLNSPSSGEEVYRITGNGSTIQSGPAIMNGGFSFPTTTGYAYGDLAGFTIADELGNSITTISHDGTATFGGFTFFNGGLLSMFGIGGLLYESGIFDLINPANGEPTFSVINDMTVVYGDMEVHGGITFMDAANGITFGDGTTQTTSAEPFSGTLNNTPFIMTNELGDMVTFINTDGSSFINGPLSLSTSFEITDEFGAQLLLSPGLGFYLTDAALNPIASINTDGMAFLYSGLEIPGEGFNNITLMSGWFSFPFADGGQFLLTPEGMHMTSASGETTMSVNSDGTSVHNGLEEFNGGVIIRQPDGTQINLDNDGLSITGPTGNVAHILSADGTSYHGGNEEYENGMTLLGGGITFPDGSVQTTAGGGLSSNLPPGFIYSGDELGQAVPTQLSGDVLMMAGGETMLAPMAVSGENIAPEAIQTYHIAGSEPNAQLVTNSIGQPVWNTGRTTYQTQTCATATEVQNSTKSVIYYTGATVLGYANLPAGSDGEIIYLIFQTGQTTLFGKIVLAGEMLSFIYMSGSWHMLK